MPGNIVFRWYDRAQADEVYRSWTVEQLAKRLEEAKTSTGEPPLGKPGVATTESLERLLHDWRAQGRAVQRICEIEAERPADYLLRYELLCDACTQSEWRAKEAFFLRHLLGLCSPAEPERSGETGAQPETSAAGKALDARTAPLHTGAAQADLETTYSASREGRFSWREWSLLTDALKRLEWNRWAATFRASYEADKATRRGGVEQALRQNYQAFDELRQRLKEGDERGWALVVYEANDERLPFPPPAMLADAARQTAASVDEARRQAEATLARRRRLQRIVVPVILIVVFWLLGFLFTQSLLGAAIVAAVIALIISVVVYAIIRRPT